jgi:serine-type D-Ala-D-Ala carboxypeptidase (penicillin-binding protein 5/6)
MRLEIRALRIDQPSIGVIPPLLRLLTVVGLLVFPLAGQAGLDAVVPAPSLDAKSYVLTDYQTGLVLAEKNSHERVEPASLTKIMSVYTAAHALKSGLIKLDDAVTVSEKAWKAEGSRMFIEVGKTVSVDDLLQGIIVQSGNDASIALAEHVSGTESTFADLMNKYARDLGMTKTHFANSDGLPDPQTYTTAHDMALLAAALIREHPEIYRRFADREFVFNGIKQPNRNRLLYRDETVDGIKTGHTESAGFCLVSSAVREGMRVIAVVMGTASDTARTEASAALINYGYRFFETRDLYPANKTIASARVWHGVSEELALGTLAPVAITVPRGKFEQIKAVAQLQNPIIAPIKTGQQLGQVSITIDGEPITEVPLVALVDIAEGSMFSRLYDDVMMLFE